MQAIFRKFIRVARWVGLVLIAGTAWAAPPRLAAPPVITVSPEPPTGWLSGGEYPITATATSDESETPERSAGALRVDRRFGGRRSAH